MPPADVLLFEQLEEWYSEGCAEFGPPALPGTNMEVTWKWPFGLC